MGDKSAIEWTDATWNPVTGCSKVSPGCAHCYAETLALNRLAGKKGYPGLPWTPENAAENVVLRPERLDQPLRWRKRRMVFVNSMSDLFHDQVPDEFIDRVFGVMALSGVAYVGARHTFQVLTKRPERMRDYLADPKRSDAIHRALDEMKKAEEIPVAFRRFINRRQEAWLPYLDLPLPNVWLGTSIENRRYVSRADFLRATPAAVRFISAEPLLGPLVPDGEVELIDTAPTYGPLSWADGMTTDENLGLDLADIDWLIVGGESGKGHRPIKEEWVRALLDASTTTETAFFFKQWGGHTPKAGGRELDGRAWDEMPTAV